MLFHTQIASGELNIYMNDMAMHTEGETEEEHLEQHCKIVNKVLAILEANNLYLNINKCKFKQLYINFLEVHVKDNQLKMEDAKIEKVRDWMLLRNLKKVQRFLRFTSYYCYFIKEYSVITRPLLELTKQTTL